MENSFEAYLGEKAGVINAQMKNYLAQNSSDEFLEKLLGKATYKYNHAAIEKALLEPSWYLLGLGGKRWRPVLMMLVIEALGKKSEDFVEFTMIPEVVHNATLVHDDAEDDSPTRRGSPAVHVKYGLDVAINLGDFLYYFPIAALMGSEKLTTRTRGKMMNIYITEMLRVCTGQGMDIAWHRSLVGPEAISEDEYLQMVYNKTGVLARMACELGAMLAGASQSMIKKFGHFGATVGVAFQIQDDLLNIMPSELANNKGGVGDDITEGKITLMVVYALKRAKDADKQRLLEILRCIPGPRS